MEIENDYKYKNASEERTYLHISNTRSWLVNKYWKHGQVSSHIVLDIFPTWKVNNMILKSKII